MNFAFDISKKIWILLLCYFVILRKLVIEWRKLFINEKTKYSVKLSYYIIMKIKSFLYFLILLGSLPKNYQAKFYFMKLNEKKVDLFIKEEKTAIILIYEDWCGFSKKALKIFENFKKNLKF